MDASSCEHNNTRHDACSNDRYCHDCKCIIELAGQSVTPIPLDEYNARRQARVARGSDECEDCTEKWNDRCCKEVSDCGDGSSAGCVDSMTGGILQANQSPSTESTPGDATPVDNENDVSSVRTEEWDRDRGRAIDAWNGGHAGVHALIEEVRKEHSSTCYSPFDRPEDGLHRVSKADMDYLRSGEDDPESDYACKWCGRCVLVGGPCCEYTSEIARLNREVEVARHLQSRESRSRAKLQRKYDELSDLVEAMRKDIPGGSK